MLTFTEVDEIPNSRKGRKSGSSPNPPRGDSYWFTLARITAQGATCPRKSVGVIIVRNEEAVASGYNHHDEECTIDGNSCVSSVHAEVMAVEEMKNKGESFRYGDKMYATLEPCDECKKRIPSWVKVYYEESYNDYLASKALD